MGKYYKAALATLYLLQVVIVFREPIAYVIGLARTAWTGHADRPEAQARDGGFLVLVRHAFNRRDNPQVALLATDQPVRELRPVVHGHENTNETHPTEHKDRTRRHKRRLVTEYLIANLFPQYRRHNPTAEAQPGRQMPIRLTLKFPSAA
jgi:hypothetical protein